MTGSLDKGQSNQAMRYQKSAELRYLIFLYTIFTFLRGNFDLKRNDWKP